MTALAVTLPLALVLSVAIIAAALRDALARSLASAERRAESRARTEWEGGVEARLGAAEERLAVIAETSEEVLRRARAAGLGEALGRR